MHVAIRPFIKISESFRMPPTVFPLNKRASKILRTMFYNTMKDFAKLRGTHL